MLAVSPPALNATVPLFVTPVSVESPVIVQVLVESTVRGRPGGGAGERRPVLQGGGNCADAVGGHIARERFIVGG